MLLERRPAGTGRFAGHLSFPGGRIEADDDSPLDAALREAEEEIGFAASEVQILGHLIDTRDPVGRQVACFVGQVALDALPETAASPEEVDEMILVPLADLLKPLGPREGTAWPRCTYRAVDYEARALPSQERFVQYWRLEEVAGERAATLWGFTAGLLGQLFSRVYDWSPPRPPRLVADWDELLP